MTTEFSFSSLTSLMLIINILLFIVNSYLCILDVNL